MAKAIHRNVAAVDREVTKRRAVWTARARASKGRGDPDLDLFYFQVIETWRKAGGKVAVANTKTGGPAVRFLCKVTELIGHKLTVGGAKQ